MAFYGNDLGINYLIRGLEEDKRELLDQVKTVNGTVQTLVERNHKLEDENTELKDSITELNESVNNLRKAMRDFLALVQDINPDLCDGDYEPYRRYARLLSE